MKPTFAYLRCRFRNLSSLLVVLCWCVPAWSQVISTVAGSTAGFSGDGGPALNARFSNPISVAPGPGNTLYISDFYNFRIRKVNLSTGVVTTVAGNGTQGYSGDNGPAINARLESPGDLVVDDAGNVYFCDMMNYCVRRIDGVTGIITTVIGRGAIPYNGGSAVATSVRILIPQALAMGKNGESVYLVTVPSPYVVRLDVATGMIDQFAGNGNNTTAGDGGNALDASFQYPSGLALAPGGELFIADALAHRIRLVAANGTISTMAGSGNAGYVGDGSAATAAYLQGPTGVGIEPGTGNVYIADRDNQVIRMVDISTGVITTVAGHGVRGFGGDGLIANSACVFLNDPHKVRFDAAGNYYISDQSNNRIRKVTPGAAPPPSAPTLLISATSNSPCAGTLVEFTAVATNTSGTTSYQWKVDNVNNGSNSPDFAISNLADGQVVTCEMTTGSGCGADVTVISNALPVTRLPAVTPTITITSLTSFGCDNGTLDFSATITNGGSSPEYQWKVDGVNTGGNQPTLQISSTVGTPVVTCLLRSDVQCATPSGTVTSNTLSIPVYPASVPTVTIVSSAGVYCAGESASFEASNNLGPYSPIYQWMVNGINVGGSTQVFTSNSLADGDVISCHVAATVPAGCLVPADAVSDGLVVSINNAAPASISITADDNELCAGDTARFNATALNAGTGAAFSWMVNGADLAGANGPVLSGTFRDADKISCRLVPGMGACSPGNPVSNIVQMTVHPKPVLTADKEEIFISPGNSASLNVNVSPASSSYTWSPADLLLTTTVLNPTTRPLTQDVVFSIEAGTPFGCTSSKSVAVKIFTDLFIPTAFTPNNDGINDLFRIPDGTGINLDDFSIFNRWGGKVFTTKDSSKGWDGTQLGQPLPAGVYVFRISGKQGDKKIFVKGTVTLVR
ncbi:MAG: T9SS type B sorting domain-containing protein [Chitinophagaceae bacterium]|nr:MAG: T9SS type B sorting domain-containing protein [Chitinophagaceae bacterium]